MSLSDSGWLIIEFYTVPIVISHQPYTIHSKGIWRMNMAANIQYVICVHSSWLVIQLSRSEVTLRYHKEDYAYSVKFILLCSMLHNRNRIYAYEIPSNSMINFNLIKDTCVNTLLVDISVNTLLVDTSVNTLVVDKSVWQIWYLYLKTDTWIIWTHIVSRYMLNLSKEKRSHPKRKPSKLKWKKYCP